MNSSERQLRGVITLIPKIVLAVLLITGIGFSLQLLFGHLPTIFQSVSNLDLAHSPNSENEDLEQTVSEQNQSYGPITKALVVASTTKDDTSWLSHIPPSLNWTLYHYRVDKPITPSYLKVPSSKGNEAMVYLTYIIDNYDNLPDIIFFHHAHPAAWHQHLSSLTEVTRLRPEYILEAGYASTRCLKNRENVITLEGGKVGDWDMFPRLDRKTHLVTLLDAFLEPDKGETEIPPKIAAPCCAQFAVSRDRVRSRSKDWWEALREWIIHTPLQSMNSGRLMEHLWHIWFGMPAELSVILHPSQFRVGTLVD